MKIRTIAGAVMVMAAIPSSAMPAAIVAPGVEESVAVSNGVPPRDSTPANGQVNPIIVTQLSDMLKSLQKGLLQGQGGQNEGAGRSRGSAPRGNPAEIAHQKWAKLGQSMINCIARSVRPGPRELAARGIGPDDPRLASHLTKCQRAAATRNKAPAQQVNRAPRIEDVSVAVNGERKKLKKLAKYKSSRVKKAVDAALKAWDDYENNTWTVALLKLRNKFNRKNFPSFAKVNSRRGSGVVNICGYDEGMRYFYKFAKPTGALERVGVHNRARMTISHPGVTSGDKIYSPEKEFLYLKEFSTSKRRDLTKQDLISHALRGILRQSGCSGIIIRKDRIHELLKHRDYPIQQKWLFFWKDVKIFDPSLKARAKKLSLKAKSTKKQVIASRATKKALAQARAKAIREESKIWRAAIAGANAELFKVLQVAKGDILVFLNTRSTAFEKKQISRNLNGELVIRKSGQIAAAARGILKRLQKDELVAGLLNREFSQRNAKPAKIRPGIFKENKNFNKSAGLGKSFAIVIIGSEDLMNVAEKSLDGIIGARKALLTAVKSGALKPWFRIAGKAIQDARNGKIAAAEADRQRIRNAQQAEKERVHKSELQKAEMIRLRDKKSQNLAAQLDAGSLTGHGLLALVPVRRESEICVENSVSARVVAHYRRTDWAARGEEIPAGKIRIADLEKAFQFLQEGRCGAVFGKSESLKILMGALRRDGLKASLYSEWIDRNSFEASNARLEKEEKEAMARAAAERLQREAAARAERDRRREQARLARLERDRKYPFVARITCNFPGGGLPFYSCIEKLKLRVDGHTRIYELYQIMNGAFESRGNELLVPLTRSFEIRVQNTGNSDSTNLEVIIEDRQGKRIYQDQVSQYRSVAVNN